MTLFSEEGSSQCEQVVCAWGIPVSVQYDMDCLLLMDSVWAAAVLIFQLMSFRGFSLAIKWAESLLPRWERPEDVGTRSRSNALSCVGD